RIVEIQAERRRQAIRDRISDQPEAKYLRKSIPRLGKDIRSTRDIGEGVDEARHPLPTDEVESDVIASSSHPLTRGDDVDVRIGGILCPVDELDLRSEVVHVAGDITLAVEEDARKRGGSGRLTSRIRNGTENGQQDEGPD